jgi:hypothetical protein
VDRCDECRFDYYTLPRAEVPDGLRASGADHLERLTETPVAFLREHPQPGWSALEYACHVRDVLGSQRNRVDLAQREHEPIFVPMDRDELAVDERYNEQDPSVVAAELAAAAEALATQLEDLDEAGWARTGVYAYPDRARRDVDWIARHSLHELHHHLADVDRVLLAVLES